MAARRTSFFVSAIVLVLVAGFVVALVLSTTGHSHS
jgi:hypothetical protein